MRFSIVLLIICILLLSSTVHAQDNKDCNELADEVERAVCFDVAADTVASCYTIKDWDKYLLCLDTLREKGVNVDEELDLFSKIHIFLRSHDIFIWWIDESGNLIKY